MFFFVYPNYWSQFYNVLSKYLWIPNRKLRIIVPKKLDQPDFPISSKYRL